MGGIGTGAGRAVRAVATAGRRSRMRAGERVVVYVPGLSGSFVSDSAYPRSALLHPLTRALHVEDRP